MELADVCAVVTGAASGIGRCFAYELARAGAAVAAVDIDAAGLDRMATEATGARGRLHTFVCDVSREDAVRAAVQQAVGALGFVNVLVNNAAILRDGLLVSREDAFVRKLPTAQWRSVIETNLTGSYLMAREVAAHMLERRVRPALLVNISSLTREGNTGQSNYSASKSAVDALTRTWALELAQHGIRVGGIAPGLVDTPMLAGLAAAEREALEARVPLGRVGQPQEIWLALRFIIECEFFTGRVISVDGGAAC
jgi:3-oxoacyl-[acyl-carrier protein] reductase